MTVAARSLSDARLAVTPRCCRPALAIRLSQFRFGSSFESKPENAKTESEPADKPESEDPLESKIEGAGSESEPAPKGESEDLFESEIEGVESEFESAPKPESEDLFESNIEGAESESEPAPKSGSEDLSVSQIENAESESESPSESQSASADDPLAFREGTSNANPTSEIESVAETESEDSFEDKFASAVHTSTSGKAARKVNPEELDSWGAGYVKAIKPPAPGKAALKASSKPKPKPTDRSTAKTNPEPVLSPESQASFEAALRSAFDPSAFDGARPNVESEVEPKPAFDRPAFDDDARGNEPQVDPEPVVDRSALASAVAHIPRSEETQTESANPFRRFVETYTSGKKEKTQTRDTPTYLFSNHVLDLGAEVAVGVRDYDEADEKALTEKWNVRDDAIVASRKRLLNLTHDANRAKERYEETASNPKRSHWRIRQSDVLSIALQGMPAPPVDTASSTGEPSPPENEARTPGQMPLFIEMNGIPKAIYHDYPTLLWWMAARTNDDKPAELALQAPVGRHTRLDGFEEFRRLLSAAIASGKGVEGSDVFQMSICKTWLEGPDKPAELQSFYGVLLFISELDTAFRMADYKTKFHLCRIALDHASRGLFIERAAYFLRLLTEWVAHGPAQYMPVTFPDAIQESLYGLSHSLDIRRAGTELISRSDVLSLLTGCGAAGRAFDFAFRDVMMHKKAREVSYAMYIELLARLGALRTLWMEWGRITALEKDNGPGDAGLPKAEMFMQALIVARKAVRDYDLQDVEVREEIEDVVMEDCQSTTVDLDLVGRLAVVGRSAKKRIPPRLPFQLIEAFEMDSMVKAVARIQQLIGELDID